MKPSSIALILGVTIALATAAVFFGPERVSPTVPSSANERRPPQATQASHSSRGTVANGQSGTSVVVRPEKEEKTASANTNKPLPPKRDAASPSVSAALSAVDAAVVGSASIQAPTYAERGEPFEVILLVQPGPLQPLLALAKLESEAKDARSRARGISSLSRSTIETVAAEAVLVPQMSASLTGIGFQIDPNAAREQSVLAGSPTRWSWQVSSTESGLRTLSVRLSGQVKVAGTEVNRTFHEGDVPLPVEP
jgi:hypothetical protein